MTAVSTEAAEPPDDSGRICPEHGPKHRSASGRWYCLECRLRQHRDWRQKKAAEERRQP